MPLVQCPLLHAATGCSSNRLRSSARGRVIRRKEQRGRITCREPISGTLTQKSRFSVPDTFVRPDELDEEPEPRDAAIQAEPNLLNGGPAFKALDGAKT
jgi:hypothetical protein